MVSALLLNPSKNRLFLHCTNVVSLLQPRRLTGSPCTGWLLWALITALDGLSVYLGVISNSSEGWYDPMMTSGDMLITVHSWDRHMSAVTLNEWRRIYLWSCSVYFVSTVGSESNLLEAVEKNALMDFMENMENITSSVNWLIIYKADMQDKLSDILSWHMKKNDRNAGLR